MFIFFAGAVRHLASVEEEVLQFVIWEVRWSVLLNAVVVMFQILAYMMWEPIDNPVDDFWFAGCAYYLGKQLAKKIEKHGIT